MDNGQCPSHGGAWPSLSQLVKVRVASLSPGWAAAISDRHDQRQAGQQPIGDDAALMDTFVAAVVVGMFLDDRG
jgi:hypothetical protein